MTIRLQNMLRVQAAQLDYRGATALAAREAPPLIEQAIELGASLRELARRCGKSPTYLCGIRRGSAKCSPETFVLLSAAVAELERNKEPNDAR